MEENEISYFESRQFRSIMHRYNHLADMVAITGFVFWFLKWPGYPYMVIIGFSSLSVVYLLSVFGSKGFIGKTNNLGTSIFLIGFVFKVMHWPGADIMLLSAGATIFLCRFLRLFESVD